MKMAPTKQNGTTAALIPQIRKTITTRSKAANNQNLHPDDQPLQRGKRKADLSPIKNDRGVKRSALGNLTNAVVLTASESDTDGGLGLLKGGTKTSIKQATNNILHTFATNMILQGKKGTTAAIKTEVFTKPDPDGPKTRAATKTLTRAASRQQQKTVTVKSTNSTEHPLQQEISTMSTALVKTKDLGFNSQKTTTTTSVAQQVTKPKRRITNEFEKTEDSLYVSALEDITVGGGSLRLSENFESTPTRLESVSETDKSKESSPRKKTPEGVEDFDLSNWNDIFQVSHYAQDIFQYQKDREVHFVIPDYMVKQPHISKWMRALLVDWMVEIQESFELNHETLYLAVKIVDIYLSRTEIERGSLQLLGAAALFIAAKYDERIPPTVDDFHYICDGAYQRREMILMEMNVFKTIGYDLGIPLSYRFLRRYARVNRIDMPVLTLARYILEYTLMDYSIVQLRDSKLACAALFIAMRINNMPGWNKTLEFYSGYKIEEFADIAILLNNIMTRKPKESLNTVRHKYSHELFFESAKKPFITDLTKLFDTTGYQPPKQPSALCQLTDSTVSTVATAAANKTHHVTKSA
ncbi:G2/mitotic-specific cyclin-B3 [Uranotaenia lowii]|uniref:G2/mitotic-specific cyclin-B3 n=1 Tax=Uranotaenia lowii TaxID=190385 RepID=UPI00247A2B50|nr:G2/mitotic-specific cyclin-B3 [Uranotaenia lowii]XP_055586867.1 G2/mitotic-specific cyclin-B3 [Uranotaenia lowii]